MRAQFTAAIAILTLAGSTLHAQSPAPVIVQAITPESAKTPRVAPVSPASTPDATLKLLQEIKAANAEVLSKQAETLQQLDELEKAADQIKIFSKRG